MPRAVERSQSRRDSWLFALCMVLSGVALFAPPRVGAAVAGALRRTALAPFVWLQERAAEGRTSRARYRAMERARDSLAEVARDVPLLAAENTELRQLLGLGRRLGQGFVAAEVLRQTQPTDGRTLLLDAGADRGIRPFDPVIAPAGLIGVVRDVDRHTSIVMTWAHPEFRVSAVTAAGSVAGLVGPTATGEAGRTALEFRAVTYRDTVALGTMLVTSGLGGVYPRGVPVGTVLGVEREQTGWERTYRVRPAASPSAVGHVLILHAAGRPLEATTFLPEVPPRAADSAAPGAGAPPSRAESAATAASAGRPDSVRPRPRRVAGDSVAPRDSVRPRPRPKRPATDSAAAAPAAPAEPAAPADSAR